MKRIQQGEQDAFIELVQPIHAELYRMAFAYVNNEADAIDMIQQAIIQGFEQIEKLREPKYFKTWMVRIVMNCCKTFLQKRKRVDLTDPAMLQDTQVVSHTYKEEEIDLWQALQSLEEKYKSALLLRYHHDYTVPEIADILEMPVGTVKTNIRRGLLQLRQLLKGAYIDDWVQSVEDDTR